VTDPAARTVRLRPYQVQAVEAVFSAFRRGVHRQLVVMATGLGKTVVVAAVAARSRWAPDRRFFGIMHREELIAQAREKLALQNPERSIGIEKARDRAPDGCDIVLASVQTVARGAAGRAGARPANRLARFVPSAFSKVWIDEVHHAPARSYITVLDHLGLHDNPTTPKLLIGTTATPDRLDRMGYDRLFDDVVFRYGLREGISDGWLADLACYRVATDTDVSGVRVRAGEFVEAALARAVDTEPRNALCLDAYRRHARGVRNLVFCVTKDHARHVAALFEAAGVRVGLVVEDTPAPARRETIAAFRAGEIEVLVNVSILIEGFDVPEVEAIHLLRPTRSTALLMQMIGRGTRRVAGKDRCLVFDYADDFDEKDLVAVGTLFGLPGRFDFRGGEVLEQVRAIESLERELGSMPFTDLSSLEAVGAVLEAIDPLKLYASTAEETAEHSVLRWQRSGEDRYALSWRNRSRRELEAAGRGTQWVAEEARAIAASELWGRSERLEVRVNELGTWEVVLSASPPGAAAGPSAGAACSSERLVLARDLPAALGRADAWIYHQRPHVVRLLDRTAAWNFHPASRAQIDALVRRGFPADRLRSITKGQAAILMDKPVPGFLRLPADVRV
jgi:ATP-dependent helicase IRC3